MNTRSHYLAMMAPVSLARIFLAISLLCALPVIAGRLHDAAKKGDLAKAERIIKKGTDVNVKDAKGASPLHWAALKGHTAVVELLIDRGAEIDAQDQNGTTALQLAARVGHERMVEILVNKGAGVDVRDHYGGTALFMACLGAHTNVAEFLITKGADVKARNSGAYTPLHIAARQGQVDMVKLLIDKGAEVDAWAQGGIAPVHEAAFNGHAEVTELLIDKGAEVDTRAWDGTTPLHMAAHNGHIPVVKLLLDKGAEVNARDEKGHTPLGWAVNHGHKAVADLLRMHGAKQTAESAAGGEVAKNRYELYGFSVASPTGERWQVKRATRETALFDRSTGRGGNHTVAAWAAIVKGTHAVGNPNEFLRQTTKQHIKEFKVSTRYSNLHFDVTDTRKYGLSCRECSFTVEDHGVPYAPGKTFILHGWVLDCLHPKSPVPLILMLSASQRYLQGLQPLSLDTELERFREEVRVMPIPEYHS